MQRFRSVMSRLGPDRVLLVNATTDDEWTFRRLEEQSNRVANYFLQKGYRRGDSVALYMDNRDGLMANCHFRELQGLYCCKRKMAFRCLHF